MTEYRLSMMDDFDEPGADASPYVRFRISEGEAIGVARARVSRAAMALGSLQSLDWRRVLSLAVLQEAESQLSAGLLTRDDGADLTLEYGAYNEELLTELAGGLKQCEWRRSAEPRGSLCVATGAGGSEPTSIPLCESCEMPDARWICSALVHPETKYQGGVGVYSGGSGFSSDPHRMVRRAFCEVHVQQQDWTKCQAGGGRECWHRVVRDGTGYPKPESGAPARLVDEIPYLRLAYGERFGTKPSKFWPSIDERTVASILTDPTTAPEFQQRISAVDALITRMAPAAQLDSARRVDEQGHRVGSIIALARVLEDQCGGAALPFVERLRALHKARNSFPAHPHSDDLASALRTLGVAQYPPFAWQLAWWQVTASLVEALAAVRIALQTSAPSASD